jgi:hypothetical protein
MDAFHERGNEGRAERVVVGIANVVGHGSGLHKSRKDSFELPFAIIRAENKIDNEKMARRTRSRRDRDEIVSIATSAFRRGALHKSLRRQVDGEFRLVLDEDAMGRRLSGKRHQPKAIE